jgi:hypothetical protein
VPAISTYTKAIKTLEGLIDITQRERLNHVGYLDMESLAGNGTRPAVCEGTTACLLGSTWMAHGAKLVQDQGGDDWYFDGVYQKLREDYLRHRPALRLVYDTLNAEARKVLVDECGYTDEDGVLRDSGGCFKATFESEAEELFERGLAGGPTRQQTIDATRKRVIELAQTCIRKLKADMAREHGQVTIEEREEVHAHA